MSSLSHPNSIFDVEIAAGSMTARGIDRHRRRIDPHHPEPDAGELLREKPTARTDVEGAQSAVAGTPVLSGLGGSRRIVPV
ncbi:hypothetical protein [Rhodococcus qingshengii]|uniref:hypothetical protein n=1 Tax=Rhodococcus qingshengii TaxID=334542 RepID=UPI0024B90CD8|nr:hypothetical protein [Rhodococcus qingshengii]MDJ0441398.1 hypothetical protein [Rhodococcus qingshengii]